MAVSEPPLLRVGPAASSSLRSRKQSPLWRRAIATLRRTSTLHSARVRRIAKFNPRTAHEFSAQAMGCY